MALSTIEVAVPAHVPLMAEIHRFSFPSGEAWDAKAIDVQLGLPGSIAFVNASGFILARALAGEAELLTLAVVPEARGRGIGRALLYAAMRKAASCGAETLYLEVAESNAAALSLYMAAGAKPVGRRRRYYPTGADALVCCISLSVLR
jgi:ribosomal-protein-alanine N-acetyltransferase